MVIASLLTMGGHSVLLIMRGQIRRESLTVSPGQWAILAAAILTSLAFFLLIPVRIKRDWRTRGVFAAFIVSLFAEMYGFPLTVYFISTILGLTYFEKEFMLYAVRPRGRLIALDYTVPRRISLLARIARGFTERDERSFLNFHPEHCENFQEFMRNGGLHTWIQKWGQPLEAEYPFWGETVAVVVANRSASD